MKERSDRSGTMTTRPRMILIFNQGSEITAIRRIVVKVFDHSKKVEEVIQTEEIRTKVIERIGETAMLI